MKHFTYLARDRAGTLTRGTQTAESPQGLQSLLEATGLSLVSFSASSSPAGTPNTHAQTFNLATSKPAKSRSHVLGAIASQLSPSSRAMELAMTQMAMMLRSGLDLRGTLQTVLEQTTSMPLANALSRVIHQVEQGQSLQAALASTRVFPEIVVQLVGVGETTGNLSQVLQRASQHMAVRRQSIMTVRMALAYPTLVATAALSIAVYLVVAVIPELSKMLSAMGRRLPRMTQSLVDLSSWLHLHGSTCAVLFFASAGGLVALRYWPPGRLMMDRFLLTVPLIGSVFRLSGTATLSSSLAVMIRSGTRLVDALAIAERLQSNQVLALRIQRSRRDVIRGESISHELSNQPGYVPMLSSMLRVAERTGQLEQSLEEVANYCDSELQTRIKRLSVLVEPAIIVFAGVIVGYVYMAFFLALMSAGGNIR